MSELILVTLPIGNIKDITIRAKEALENGKIFYAEDTRVFKDLLEKLGISYKDKNIDSFHDHSENKVDKIIARLKAGEAVYLVSDAGSPIISDPAYPLVKKAKEENVKITSLSGISSVLVALELSGLPPHPFHFWGFIGRSKSEKNNFFKKLNSIEGTHIFFESPHRIYETIEDFFLVNKNVDLIVARELTKNFETVSRLSINNYKNIREIIVDKGEFVLLFHVDKVILNPLEQGEVSLLVNDYLENGGGVKKLSKIFSRLIDVDAKVIYNKLNNSGK